MPLQPLMAPFKGEPVTIQKPDKYQNDQLHMGPIQAPYSPVQNPLTASVKGDNFPMQHHKIHQNLQLNKQRKMHPLRPPEHS